MNVRNTVTARARVGVLAAGIAILPGASLLAQEQPPAQRAEPARESLGRDAAKALLQRRLDEMDAMRQEVTDAMARLDQGERPMDVLRDLPVPPGRRGERRGEARERLLERMDHQRPDWEGPGPDGPPGEAPPRDRPPKLDRDELLALLASEMPEVAVSLDDLRQVEPRAADRLVDRLLPRLRQTAGEKARDEELYRLRIRELRSMFALMRATREYRVAKVAKPEQGGSQATLEKHLRDAAENAFDDRLAVQRREADLLERRVRDLREDIAKRAAEKERLIDDGLERIAQGGPILPPPGPEPTQGDASGPPPPEPR